MSWDNTGNADTNPDLDFVGTTDHQPLVLRTNSVEALRIDSDGNVGVGTANPVSKLEIIGDWKDGQQGAQAHRRQAEHQVRRRRASQEMSCGSFTWGLAVPGICPS